MVVEILDEEVRNDLFTEVTLPDEFFQMLTAQNLIFLDDLKLVTFKNFQDYPSIVLLEDQENSGVRLKDS